MLRRFHVTNFNSTLQNCCFSCLLDFLKFQKGLVEGGVGLKSDWGRGGGVTQSKSDSDGLNL